MLVKAYITLKKGVLDPQGKAIHHALNSLGFDKLNSVRQGKVIELDLATDDPKQAKAEAIKMCEQLLANMVIEDFEVEV